MHEEHGNIFLDFLLLSKLYKQMKYLAYQRVTIYTNWVALALKK